jgi:hypothetical protein
MIEKAITIVQRTLRDYIRRDEEMNITVYTKVLSHLINSWAEVRVLKLVYETGAFTDPEKGELIDSDTVEKRWEMALTTAFCKAYKVSAEKINSVDTPVTPRTRYRVLLELIKEDLLESSQLRNRIAHGQWQYAFNNDLRAINPDLTRKLREENIVNLQLKFKMFKSLAQIIHDLAVSRLTFERDFDKNFRKVEGQRTNFHNRRYEDYKSMLMSRRQKYLQSKQSSC